VKERVILREGTLLEGRKHSWCEEMEEEFAAIHTANSWDLLYRQISNESRNNDFTAVEALKVENKQLNRYRDVYPYDHSRVPLVEVVNTDYINASLLTCSAVDRSYILTQGPLQATTGHFWSMVWQQKSRAVIMLNRVIEKGTLKCHQYWPASAGETVTCEAVELSITNVDFVPGENYNVSTLRLTHLGTEEEREVLHFHYTTWPDFGVPTCPDTFLQFLDAVRDSDSLSSSVGPAVVHCSAGIGRSGTFVLVDTCLLEAQLSGTQAVNVKERLLDMRTYRMGLIQTPDQLKFSYLSIMEGAKQLGLVDSVPDYEAPVAEASDSDSEEEVPPPLPPPRTESLKKEVVLVGENEVTITDAEPFNSADSNQAEEKFTSMPSKLPTQVNGYHGEEAESHGPDSGSSTTSSLISSSTDQSADHSPNKIILTEQKLEERKREMELKRRKKKEETTSTENKIAQMKKEIHKAEEWSRRKEFWRQNVLPFCVGLFICAIGYLQIRTS